MDFNYSVILDKRIQCINETVEEAETAALFEIEYLSKLNMSRMEQLGIVLEKRKIHPACKLAVTWLICGMRI